VGKFGTLVGQFSPPGEAHAPPVKNALLQQKSYLYSVFGKIWSPWLNSIKRQICAKLH